MKLELKHLAPYLPYKLNIYGSSEIWELIGIDPIVVDEIDLGLVLSNDSVLNDGASILEHSPILHPLSDLNKEIEVNGKRFIPMKIFSRVVQSEIQDAIDCDVEFDILPYYIISLLLSWHFDVFGLINEKLAIDINTL